MRPFRHAGSLNVFVILAAGSLAACSSSSKSNGTGGATGSGGMTTSTGGKTGSGGGTGAGGVTGTGGATNDASTDAPKDASTDVPKDAPATDTQGSDVLAGFDAPYADGATSPSNMTLTIAALAGGTFPDVNTCAGVNTSPAMSWTAGPTGTMSYAVVLTDTFQNAAHWVIWDIPSTVTSLAAALPGDATLTTPAGAQQLHKAAFFGAGFDYRGPCPKGTSHTYQFEVTAVPTATLALGPNPTTEQIRAVLQNVGIGHGDLMANSSASPPPADAAADSSGQ